MSSTAFTLTPSDLLAAWRLQRRKNIFVMVVRWSPVALLAAWLLSERPNLTAYGWEALLWDWQPLIIIALLPAMNLVVDRVVLPRKARRFLGQSRGLKSELNYDWDATGISIFTDAASNRLAWIDFVRWLEDDASLMLFQTDNMFNTLPKRSLTEAQLVELRGYLSNAIGKMGKTRKLAA